MSGLLEAIPNGSPPVVAEDASPSLVDRLRARQDAARARAAPIKLPVPGWNGDLVAEYRVLKDIAAVREIGDKVLENPDDPVGPMLDLLARACIDVHLRNEAGGLDSLGTGYTKALADMLGADASTARAVVLHVFGDNEIAVDRHAAKLIDWMSDTSAPVEGAEGEA